MSKVIIVVEGGVAYAYKDDEEIEVEILDYDESQEELTEEEKDRVEQLEKEIKSGKFMEL